MPARLRKFARAAKDYGFDLEVSNGPHPYKLRKVGERIYTVPAHNGEKTEVSDKYMKAFCHQYGIDWEEFRKKL